MKQCLLGGGLAQCTGKVPTDLLVFCKWDFVVSSAASCGLQEGRGGRKKPAWPSPGAALVLEGCSRMQHPVKKDAGGKCGDSDGCHQALDPDTLSGQFAAQPELLTWVFKR